MFLMMSMMLNNNEQKTFYNDGDNTVVEIIYMKIVMIMTTVIINCDNNDDKRFFLQTLCSVKSRISAIAIPSSELWKYTIFVDPICGGVNDVSYFADINSNGLSSFGWELKLDSELRSSELITHNIAAGCVENLSKGKAFLLNSYKSHKRRDEIFLQFTETDSIICGFLRLVFDLTSPFQDFLA
uniref:Uncharacterized protein n=1 Tax=Glossina austeni TaxID=7395 RepID=A0A1A9VQ11_GLOAU